MANTFQSNTKIDQYNLIRVEGTGGFGEVWRARDTTTEQEVAIKKPRYNGPNHEHVVDKYFSRELKALEAVKNAGGHPNIMTLYNHLVYDQLDDEMLILILEFIEGQELEDVVSGSNSFSASETRQIGIEVTDAMSFLHRNMIVYRDLKPDNIRLKNDGTPVLIDFSTAKKVDRWTTPLRHTSTGSDTSDIDPSIMVPDEFKPPEVTGKTEQPQGPWSDVYSIGKVLFYMMVGYKPDDPSVRPSDFNVSCPAYLDDIIEQATQEHPLDRYGSATELKEALTSKQSEPTKSAELYHIGSDQTHSISPGSTIGQENTTNPTDISIDVDIVSDVHCRFVLQDDDWFLVDHSTNGTYVHLEKNNWKRLLCEEGRQTLLNTGFKPEQIDADGDRWKLSKGDTIALAHMNHGDNPKATWFIFLG